MNLELLDAICGFFFTSNGVSILVQTGFYGPLQQGCDSFRVVYFVVNRRRKKKTIEDVVRAKLSNISFGARGSSRRFELVRDKELHHLYKLNVSKGWSIFIQNHGHVMSSYKLTWLKICQLGNFNLA
ncbi:hypothetical protein VNO77_44760 [Canavalia gladiata]|uniref:Uncharacterized protein n=1 Tax=Canavalia gladiata TaxID=3824 RepID=A0AAN9JZI5_CANGL